MAATTHLNITKIEQAQSQKEATANEAFDYIDAAVADVNSISVSSSSTVTLGSTDALSAVLQFTGTVTTPTEVVVPSNDKMWAVNNLTGGGYAIRMRTALGAAISIVNRGRCFAYCDGTNVIKMTTELTGVSISVYNAKLGLYSGEANPTVD